MKVSGKPQPPKICKSSDVSSGHLSLWTISFINLSESFWLLSEFFRKYVQEIWSKRVFPNLAINQFDQSNKIKWNQIFNFSFVQESSTKFYFWMLLWLLEVLRQQTRYLSNIWRHRYFAKFKLTKNVLCKGTAQMFRYSDTVHIRICQIKLSYPPSFERQWCI